MRVIHCNAWLAGGVVGHSHSEATALRAGLYRDNNKKGLGAGRSGEAEAEASKAAAIRSAQRADKLAAQLDSAQHAAADQSCLTKELQADIPHPHVYFFTFKACAQELCTMAASSGWGSPIYT